MRRRRRTPTRIIKRKSSFDQSPIVIDKNKGKTKRVIYSSLFIIVLAAISYFSYSRYFILENEPNDQIAISDTAKTDTVKPAPPPEPVYKQPEKMIQIEVLNGCGQSGIAKVFESYLRKNGFDVINTENYRIRGKVFWNVENTKVVDQIGKPDFANNVAKSLGIDDKYVSSEDNPSPICDVTVIIGKDFKTIKAFKEFSN